MRGHCGLSAAAVEDAGVIRAARNRRCGCTGAAPGGARSGKRGWCSPFTRRRRRRRRRVRVRVAQHSGQSAASLPSPQNRHSESVAPRAAFKERVALRRHPGGRAVAAECATPTPSLIRLRRTGGTPSLRSPVRCSLRSPVYEVGPRRAFFHLRRRAGPLRLRLRWGRRVAAPWKDSTSPDNTTNNQTHLPQDRQAPHPQDQTRTPTLRQQHPSAPEQPCFLTPGKKSRRAAVRRTRERIRRGGASRLSREFGTGFYLPLVRRLLRRCRGAVGSASRTQPQAPAFSTRATVAPPRRRGVTPAAMRSVHQEGTAGGHF